MKAKTAPTLYCGQRSWTVYKVGDRECYCTNSNCREFIIRYIYPPQEIPLERADVYQG